MGLDVVPGHLPRSLLVPLSNGERVLFVTVNEMDVWKRVEARAEMPDPTDVYTIFAGASYNVDRTVTIGVGLKEVGATPTDIAVYLNSGVWSIGPAVESGRKPDRAFVLQFGDIWAAAKNTIRWTPPSDRLGKRQSCVGPRDYIYRSQLETKWAHVFDAFGWSWEYEPFALSGYIPDFILTFPDRQVLVEVKGGGHNLDDPEDAKQFVRKIERSGWHGAYVIIGDGVMDDDCRAMGYTGTDMWTPVGLCGISNPDDIDSQRSSCGHSCDKVYGEWDAVVIRRHLHNGEWSFGGVGGDFDIGMNPVVETSDYYRGTYKGGIKYSVEDFFDYWDIVPFYYTAAPMKWPRLCARPKRRRGSLARRLER
jgi:hypothetical protein